MTDTAATPSSVLIVDDEGAHRLFARHAVQQLSSECEIVEAATLTEALAAVQTRSFDLALLDLRLGIESGLALIPPLKEKNPHRVKVIVISTSELEPDIAQAQEAGADGYLPKGPTLEGFSERLRALLAEA